MHQLEENSSNVLHFAYDSNSVLTYDLLQMLIIYFGILSLVCSFTLFRGDDELSQCACATVSPVVDMNETGLWTCHRLQAYQLPRAEWPTYTTTTTTPGQCIAPIHCLYSARSSLLIIGRLFYRPKNRPTSRQASCLNTKVNSGMEDINVLINWVLLSLARIKVEDMFTCGEFPIKRCTPSLAFENLLLCCSG